MTWINFVKETETKHYPDSQTSMQISGIIFQSHDKRIEWERNSPFSHFGWMLKHGGLKKINILELTETKKLKIILLTSPGTFKEPPLIHYCELKATAYLDFHGFLLASFCSGVPSRTPCDSQCSCLPGASGLWLSLISSMCLVTLNRLEDWSDFWGTSLSRGDRTSGTRGGLSVEFPLTTSFQRHLPAWLFITVDVGHDLLEGGAHQVFLPYFPWSF